MLRAGCIGMSQVIDEADFRSPAEYGVDINLFDVAAATMNAQQREGLKFLGSLEQIAAALRLKKTKHDVFATGPELVRVFQHSIGFTDAGGVAEIDFQTSLRFLMAHGVARCSGGKARTSMPRAARINRLTGLPKMRVMRPLRGLCPTKICVTP